MKLKLLTRSVAIAIVTSLTISSCLTEEEVLTQEVMSYGGQPIILGKKLENPFSVAYMRIAYANIAQKPGGTVNTKTELSASHLYVRFLPEDENATERLFNDTTLNLTDYPLDYEVIQQGDYYHDPSIPAGRPTYLYATVPTNYRAPEGISIEILDELYLPHSDLLLLTNGRSSNDSEVLAEALEDEAFLISGHTDEVSDQEHRGEDGAARKKSKWYPSGKITVFDNRLNKYIPLEGVKVQARRWFDVAEAYTDASGNFRMDESFRNTVRYSIKWERDKFDIRSGTFGQAKLNGPKTKGEWNVQIERGGIAFHYAHVFRAALRYNYGDIGGLKRPGFRIKYSVFDKRGDHLARNIGNWSVFGINPNILIYRYSSLDGTENDADEVFSMTCHETAHATHMETMNGGAVQFLQVSETIRESWAIGVEWFITQKEYKEKGITNYGEASYKVRANYPALYGFQFWNKKRNPELTSLFIDLVDKNNQRGQTFGSYTKGTVSDPVTGYTLAGIERDFLKDVYGLSSLGDQLKTHKPAEATNTQIDILLTNF
jgi:hypothetical protein